MTNVDSSALLRTLIIYLICVPVAIFVGWLVSDPLQQQSMFLEALVLGCLAFPLLLKWHYPLMVLSWAMPVNLFFLKGHPYLFLAAVAISLTISTVERILDRKRASVPVPSIRWALIAFLAVIYLTAELTGGFGLRSMGSEVYGGKKYITLVVGILSYFAITARPIPRKDANLYIGLFLLGGVLSVVSDLYYFTPDPLKYIYLLIPPMNYGPDVTSASISLGTTRLSGVCGAGSAVFYWLLARHGFRDNMLTGRLWRPLLLALTLACVFLGGSRSVILTALLILALMFYLEKLHRTGALLVVLLLGILGGALLVPVTPHLPYTFQRSLAFLPLDISTEARMDTDDSTQWRLNMWEALMPQVPKYLLLGKGYAFSAETYDESMARDSAFKSIDAAEDPLALASDFHNGPLTVVIPFGIWGGIAWLWFWGAGLWAVWRNYRYGDEDLRRINIFILASYFARGMMFFFVVGSMVSDIAAFTGLAGLSVAINHGVSRRKAPSLAPRPKPAVVLSQPFGPPALPAAGRGI